MLSLIPTLRIGGVFQAALLLINAMAVLNEERFLAKLGWVSGSAAQNPQMQYNQGYDQNGYGGGQEVSLKAKLVDLISAVRTLMRIPLIIINILVIIYEILLG